MSRSMAESTCICPASDDLNTQDWLKYVRIGLQQCVLIAGTARYNEVFETPFRREQATVDQRVSSCCVCCHHW